jgi:hypothetical protein
VKGVDRFWARDQKEKNEEKHSKKEKKTVHVSMCSETFNL